MKRDTSRGKARREPWARVVAAACLGFGVLTPGCMVDDGPADGPRRATRPTSPPTSAQVNRLLVSAGVPQDTDGNTYPDEIVVSIYMFDDNFPSASIAPKGEVKIRAVLQSDTSAPPEVLREWSFDAAQTAAAVKRGAVGPAFIFSLSLLADGGDDRLPTCAVDIAPVFTPMNGDGRKGEPIRTKGTATVRLGRLSG